MAVIGATHAREFLLARPYMVTLENHQQIAKCMKTAQLKIKGE